ncbi:hypothetical protein, partial [Candidatus Venteria ishoeyi]|uniref:hypothetical protein n=1 Tax=Candidatus Venteria ishoeyi TaxID=1899563 RepID=UPI00255CF4AF
PQAKSPRHLGKYQYDISVLPFLEVFFDRSDAFFTKKYETPEFVHMHLHHLKSFHVKLLDLNQIRALASSPLTLKQKSYHIYFEIFLENLKEEYGFFLSR